MSRKKNTTLFSCIAIITIILIGLGLMFNKTKVEKLDGLANIYDVSINGDIAYLYYNKGKPEIHIKSENNEQLAVELETDKDIVDMSFSSDGASLAYIETGRNYEESTASTIQLIDVRSLDQKELFQDDLLITELAFDPKDGNSLFYLKAETFENYSPVARAYPHDIDIYKYNIHEEEEIRCTNFKKYSMQSLQVSPLDDTVYIQTIDDAHSESADDIFAAKQRIYEISLHEPDHLTIISDLNREIDLYDFTLIPEENAMIYQSISNEAAGETFEYELYYYDGTTKEETQLTDLQEYTESPIMVNDDTVYFIVDLQFAQQYPDYHLYKMDVQGNNITEILLNPTDP